MYWKRTKFIEFAKAKTYQKPNKQKGAYENMPAFLFFSFFLFFWKVNGEEQHIKELENYTSQNIFSC
jgi:hypothetical protein